MEEPLRIAFHQNAFSMLSKHRAVRPYILRLTRETTVLPALRKLPRQADSSSSGQFERRLAGR